MAALRAEAIPEPRSRAAVRVAGLPAMAGPLIERERELAEIALRLVAQECTLLTLVGPGGAGKTRLAAAAATRLGPAYSDGVFVVLLAGVQDPELVPAFVVQTLDVRHAGEQPPLGGLKRDLRAKQLLLVLDGFEQVLTAGAIVAALGIACPGVRMLITSCTPLRVHGEQALELPPGLRAKAEQWLAAARRALDAAGLAHAWAEGHAMPADSAIAYALRAPTADQRRQGD